ncbi:gliding motility lipoprotein GldB [Hymenobacter busanensis]|uniref:Gliding motility lipoprotein GldB n=2 Tax=Hymenobacter busanensis TaxID=2607656 RepID=A0A7L5A1R5_9BACT|nr:gliding motility lipoprotein GldB [Hymenobacter busanensis]QHJ09734.1 gliding motility lipoprotein GldB [Hymenobacter busanensis]
MLLGSCSSDSPRCELNPEVARVEAPVRLERLEKPFFQIRTPDDARRFLDQNRLFARYFLQRGQVPEPILEQTLAKLASNPGLQKLGSQADSTFGDTQKWQGDFQRMFQHVRYYFPDFKVPQVKTFVSGLSQDLFANDSLMVVSTDFFVGPKALYRPNVPNYILLRYRPEYVLPTAALAVSSKYNKKELTGTSMLAEMIQHGKALYFAEKVLPCTDDSLLVGFSGKDLKNVNFNEAKIWGHFLEKNLLYNTSPFQIQKYVGERPDVPEIDKTCPGRIGQWVGWQIVRKYMAEHPNVTLAQLMAAKDAQRILTESRYRPKPRR